MRAGQNGGAYDQAAIFEDSAYGMWSDTLVGVYRDADLDKRHRVTLSFPKVRGAEAPQPCELTAVDAGRYFVDDRGVSEEPLSDVMDCL